VKDGGEAMILIDEAESKIEVSNLEFTSLKELFEKEFPPVDYVVDRLIPRNGITAISGKPKIGKSYLSLYLALCIASGKKFLEEFEVLQGNVLVITKEDPLNLIQKRVKSLTGDSNLGIHFYTAPDLFLDSDRFLEPLIDFIKKENIKVIIIDSFRRIFKGEENSSQVIAEVHNKFKKLLACDTTIIFVHHHGKEGYFPRHDLGEKLRGSSDILAMLDSLLILESKDEDVLKITQAALRADKPLQPFLIEFPNEDSLAGFKFLDFTQPEKEMRDLAKQDILALLQTEGELYQKQIIEKLKPIGNYGDTTIKDALTELTEIKKLKTTKEGNKVYYSTAEPNEKRSESRSIQSSDGATNDSGQGKFALEEAAETFDGSVE